MSIDWSHVKSQDLDFQALVHAELSNARRLFPDQDLPTTIMALMEEVGELAQAVRQKQGPSRIQAEAIQVAAMAARVARDCDLGSLPSPTKVVPLRVVKPDDGGGAA
jgi:NTP pyrophosphatase (non-canonical NTP hydrolase)